MEKMIYISLGAILGANTRYWIQEWAAKHWSSAFPYSTLVINLSGSFLLGFILTLAADRFPLDPRLKLLATVGFLGAYTTFSTYAFESFNLMSKGQWISGLANLFGSTILGFLFVGLGVFLARVI